MNEMIDDSVRETITSRLFCPECGEENVMPKSDYGGRILTSICAECGEEGEREHFEPEIMPSDLDFTCPECHEKIIRFYGNNGLNYVIGDPDDVGHCLSCEHMGDIDDFMPSFSVLASAIAESLQDITRNDGSEAVVWKDGIHGNPAQEWKVDLMREAHGETI